MDYECVFDDGREHRSIKNINQEGFIEVVICG